MNAWEFFVRSVRANAATNSYPMPEEAVELLLAGQRIPKDVARSVFPHDLGKPQPMVVCGCSLRTRLVGDGCQTCNPDYWQRFNEPEQEQSK